MTDDFYKTKFTNTYLELIDLVNVLSEHQNDLNTQEVHDALAKADDFIADMASEL